MSTIKRETDSHKGFRLQKMRVIELMLDTMDSVDNPFVYASTEHFEDVFIKKCC